MKDGDLYCYATVSVGTHGFNIRVNEDYSSPIEFIPSSHPKLKDRIGLTRTNGVEINVEDIDKLILDDRSRRDPGYMIMVYRAGKTAQEVLDMIKPQIREQLVRYQRLYQNLLDNAKLMEQGVETITPEQPDFFCEPMKPIGEKDE